MSSTPGICSNFREELAAKEHDLLNDSLKLALYTEDANLHPLTTTAYISTNEASGTGYTAGGVLVTIAKATLASGHKLYYASVNPSWDSVSISFRYALLYNSSNSNKAVAIYDFGRTTAYVTQPLELRFPATESGCLLKL